MIRAALAALLLAAPAMADTKCLPRLEMQSRLGRQYGESFMAQWIDPQGNMVELWANETTGTLTLLTTAPGADPCIGAIGEAFSGVFKWLPGEDA